MHPYAPETIIFAVDLDAESGLQGAANEGRTQAALVAIPDAAATLHLKLPLCNPCVRAAIKGHSRWSLAQQAVGLIAQVKVGGQD